MSRVVEDAHAVEGIPTHRTPRKARTRVAEDATRTRAVVEDCLGLRLTKELGSSTPPQWGDWILTAVTEAARASAAK